MLDLRIAIDHLDYDTLVPIILPLAIKNPVAAKAAHAAYKLKTMGKTQKEKDAIAAQLINDNKNKILSVLNGKAAEKGIRGYIIGLDADIL